MASKFTTILPLILVVAIVSGCAWVLYQVYISFTKIRHSASEQMGRNNVVFTRDGVKVSYKDTSDESYVDTTQRYFVQAWNLGNTPRDEKSKKKR